MKLQLVLIAVCVCAASAGIPKKLFKKYAMKKVMESCLGEQLMSDIKMEVEAACDKCHGQEGAPMMPMIRNRLQAMLAGSQLAPRPAQYGQNVQYIAVPFQFQPVPAQGGRYKRSDHGMHGPAKILKLRNKISSIVGNVTCVLQEMKMLTADNEVDFDSIKARIMSLPLAKEFLDDLYQGMEECRQFSSCLPDSMFDKTPITAGFGKQITFFKCMKMAKVEACMKKDFREDYLPALMKDDMDMDGEESFQTIITSALLDEGGDMM